MAESLTISNLGPKASERFAIDQELIRANPDFYADPRIFDAAAISSTSPTPKSDFDELLNTATTKSSWAAFNSPENFSRSLIFSYHLIPTIGSTEEIRTALEKLKQIKTKNPEEKNEFEKLLALINELEEKTNEHANILAKRNEYQKG